jgi:hypothetical protein
VSVVGFSRSIGRVFGVIGGNRGLLALYNVASRAKSKNKLKDDRGEMASGRWAGCEAHSYHHYGAGSDPLESGAKDHDGGKPPWMRDGQEQALMMTNLHAAAANYDQRTRHRHSGMRPPLAHRDLAGISEEFCENVSISRPLWKRESERGGRKTEE